MKTKSKNLKKLTDLLFNDEAIKISEEQMQSINGGASGGGTSLAANLTGTTLDGSPATSKNFTDTDND